MIKGFVIASVLLLGSCSSNGIKATTAITCYSGGNIIFSDTVASSDVHTDTNGMFYTREDGLNVRLRGDCVITSDE